MATVNELNALRVAAEQALAKAQLAERTAQWPTNATIRRINGLWGKARKAAEAYDAAR